MLPLLKILYLCVSEIAQRKPWEDSWCALSSLWWKPEKTRKSLHWNTMNASFSPIWCLMEYQIYLCITLQSSPAPLISSLVHLNRSKNQNYNSHIQDMVKAWLGGKIPISHIWFKFPSSLNACPVIDYEKLLKLLQTYFLEWSHDL